MNTSILKKTSDVKEQAVGYYSSGSLVNPVEFSSDDNMMRLFPQHQAFWGTDALLKITKNAAVKMSMSFPLAERLMFGDVSLVAGGPVSRHRSHQNGLDIDFIYPRKNKFEDAQGNNWFSENFVLNGKLSENFDIERTWALFKYFVRTGEVNRIFVDELIRVKLREYSIRIDEFKNPLTKEILRRVQREPGHADHFHLRIKCPDGSPRAISQMEPAAIYDSSDESVKEV